MSGAARRPVRGARDGMPRSAARAVDALALLADAGRPLAATSIARGCGIPRSSTYHLLHALADRDFVAYDAAARGWTLGPRARELVDVPTVGRAMAVLDAFDHAAPELTEAQLCRRTGLALPRLRAVVAELLHHGLLVERDGALALSARIAVLAARVAPVDRLRRAARPHLVALAEETGETANLLIRERDEAVYLDQVESRHALRHAAWVGRRIPLAGSAAGAALATGHEPAIVRDGVETGVTAIACAIATTDAPPAAIGVTAPTVRMGRRALARCVAAVADAAAAVARDVSDAGHEALAGPAGEA